MSYSLDINSAQGTASLVVADGAVADVRTEADGAITVYSDEFGETLLIEITDIFNPAVTRKVVSSLITSPQKWSAGWVDSLFEKIRQAKQNHAL